MGGSKGSQPGGSVPQRWGRDAELLGGAGLCSRRALVSADIPVWMVKQAAHSDLQVLTANSPASCLLSLVKKLFISEVAITSMRLHTFYTGYPVGDWKRKGWREMGL